MEINIAALLLALLGKDGASGGGGEAAVILETCETIGETELSVIVSGTEYDAANMSRNGETAKNGTLIIHKMEE